MTESPIDKWFFYILRCADDSLYSGITTDLERRLREHNAGTGARYTRGRRPVSLAYSERLPDRAQALRREHAVKQLDRAAKLQLLATATPQSR
ncbi:GIY-YIG nuclease family protein [Immundisolibacter sp.]|uniref:GIY-YIG nuclease family protein n=1 Tax=Immundisolibacter sp. TaxID=1934948 RepID=UPI0035642517